VWVAVSLVSSQASGALARPAGPLSGNPTFLQQSRHNRTFVLLPRSEEEAYQSAMAFRLEVDLRGETTPAVTQGFLGLLRAPPFTPEACWCARTIVPSIKWRSQSTC
jgi:hypothetical protein